MDDLERFGRNLKAARLAARMSQTALGERSTLHFTEISRLELARREPRLSTMVKLADALSLSLSELVEGIGAAAETSRAIQAPDREQQP